MGCVDQCVGNRVLTDSCRVQWDLTGSTRVRRTHDTQTNLRKGQLWLRSPNTYSPVRKRVAPR